MTRARLSILGFAAGAALSRRCTAPSYWPLDPESHRFHISHDFTVSLEGQKSVHSFVRAGSEVAPDSKMFDPRNRRGAPHALRERRRN
jgi:hypothetical protein